MNFASAGIWGSLTTWEDGATRWILTPFWGPKHPTFKAPIEHGVVKKGAIAAFKMESAGSGVTLAPAWISRDMDQAEPPLIAKFHETGFQNIRVYVGHPWVRIDAIWLSATQKTRPSAKQVPPTQEK